MKANSGLRNKQTKLIISESNKQLNQVINFDQELYSEEQEIDNLLPNNYLCNYTKINL
jgi:hypothetical protein